MLGSLLQNGIAKDLHKSHSVVFVLSLPTNVNSDMQTEWSSAFDTSAQKLHMSACFGLWVGSSLPSEVNPDGSVSPALFKTEQGRAPLKLTISPSTKLSDQIDSFVMAHNFPFINTFDSHNFKKLGSLEKPLAMLAIDYSSSSSATLQSSLLGVASALNPAQSDSLVFGHIDGVRWAAFLKQYEVLAVPSFLLLDLAHEKYLSVALSAEGGDFEAVVADILKTLRWRIAVEAIRRAIHWCEDPQEAARLLPILARVRPAPLAARPPTGTRSLLPSLPLSPPLSLLLPRLLLSPPRALPRTALPPLARTAEESLPAFTPAPAPAPAPALGLAPPPPPLLLLLVLSLLEERGL
jgi:hypothetical protein